MKIKAFLILTLGCAAAVLSCSKEQTSEETELQSRTAESAPASLDGIWQKTYPIWTDCQIQSGKLSLIAEINGSAVKLSVAPQNGQPSAEGTATYDPSEGTGHLDFQQSCSEETAAVSNVEIIRAFELSSSMFAAVITMTDGTRDTCLFQQISSLPVQTKASAAELFGPVGGVKELACNDGRTIRTDKWMSELPDSTLLRRLTIAGTHDAATSSIALIPLGKDQMYDLKEQLDMGVRYFDLRIDDVGRITHGGILTKYTFKSAMDEMVTWLDAHRSEGILAEIRWEKDKVAYTAYEISLKARIASVKAYNTSIGRLFPKKKKVVPDLDTELNQWIQKSKAAYFKEASAVLNDYTSRIVRIDNNLTLSQLRGKISFYDSDNNALMDVSGHTEKGEYPDSKAMSSDAQLQARIAGVVQSMDEFTATAQSDEFFGKICSAGYIEPWATKGQIPFAKEIAPHVIGKSDEVVKAGKTIHAIVMMDYAPLQLGGKGSSFLDNLIIMNFPAQSPYCH